MTWTKLGRVYVADHHAGWAVSHATAPSVLPLDDDRLRVFAAFLDDNTVGRVGYVDVSAQDPTQVLDVSEHPVLDIGDPGTFDDNGVTPLSVFAHEGRVLLYYAGWQLGVKVRYFLFLGLAISDDAGQTFARHARVPVLERSDAEPVVRSSAHVRPGDASWRMWYAGGDRWTDEGERSRPVYELRYLESPDAASWGPEGEVCLSFDSDDEFGFARPFVVEDGSTLRMWYSIRTFSKGYRIGYAESSDGREWERLDHLAGIDVSSSGWDSEMICYPCIQPTRYGTYLFYNGNNYGESGFGVAVAEDA